VAAVSKLKSNAKENGLQPGELDEASKLKAEAHYYSYYMLETDPDQEAQGNATFN
jgi:pre-mRNA-processing factor 39